MGANKALSFEWSLLTVYVAIVFANIVENHQKSMKENCVVSISFTAHQLPAFMESPLVKQFEKMQQKFATKAADKLKNIKLNPDSLLVQQFEKMKETYDSKLKPDPIQTRKQINDLRNLLRQVATERQELPIPLATILSVGGVRPSISF